MSDHYAENFEAARKRLCAALAGRETTVGAKVETGCFLIGGNLAHDDPAFSPVYIDDYGRLWKEHHHNGEHAMVCVLDLRTLAAAIDAPPTEAVQSDWPGYG